MDNSIEARIKEIVAQELCVDESDVTANAHLEHDLGADSLDAVEIVMRLEEEFEILVDDEEKAETVQDMVRLVERLVAKKN